MLLHKGFARTAELLVLFSYICYMLAIYVIIKLTQLCRPAIIAAEVADDLTSSIFIIPYAMLPR